MAAITAVFLLTNGVGETNVRSSLYPKTQAQRMQLASNLKLDGFRHRVLHSDMCIHGIYLRIS